MIARKLTSLARENRTYEFLIKGKQALAVIYDEK
jgi:hypothetical protein